MYLSYQTELEFRFLQCHHTDISKIVIQLLEIMLIGQLLTPLKIKTFSDSKESPSGGWDAQVWDQLVQNVYAIISCLVKKTFPLIYSVYLKCPSL